MGKDKINLVLKLFPLFFFLGLAFILFKPYFLNGQVPIPADILIGHYYPWKDEVWGGRTAGYPIKNFILYDGIRQTLPWRLLAIEQFKSGKWPLWNPYILLGTPLLGNLQTAALYPLNLLFFILPELDAWSIYIFFQPVLAGVFVYFFIKTIGGSVKAGLLSGICYGFSLIMMNHLEFGIDGHTALWLPLMLGAVNKLLDTGSRRWGVLLAIAVGMTLLGGYPPPAIYNLIILAGYVLLKARPLFSKKSLKIVFWVIIAFGLAAPQILPSLDLAKKVIREETQFGRLSDETYFYPRENLLMIIAPDVYGHPSTNNYFSKIYYTDNPSIGIIGLVFVLYSIFVIKKKETKYWWFWVITPMLLMLETPLARVLRYVRIPLLSLVTPMRMIWVVSFALSVLAGLGFDYFLLIVKRKQKRNFWQMILPIIVLWELIFLSLIYVLLVSRGNYLQISLRNLILPSFFLVLASFLEIIILLFPRTVLICSFLIIMFSASELLRQGIKYNPFLEKKLVYPPVELFEKIKEDRIPRVVVTHPELIPVNANIPYKLKMLDGYASIYDGRVGQLIKLANEKFPLKKVEGYPRIVFQTEYGSSLIDLFGVKYIFSLENIKSEKLELVSQIGKTRLYQNDNAFPPAFLVTRYYIEKGDLAVANRLLTINKRDEVVLEKEPRLMIEKTVFTGNQEVVIEDYHENLVKLEVNSLGNSILVLTDSYDSGWLATIDGINTEVLRTDYNLRSITVPAGKHKVVFRYRPESFFTGLKFFIFSISLVSFIFSASFFRKLPLFKKEFK